MIKGKQFARRTIAFFDRLTDLKNSFRVALLKSHRVLDRGKLVWETYSPTRGVYLQYQSEPNTWLIPQLGVSVLGILPLEDYL